MNVAVVNTGPRGDLPDGHRVYELLLGEHARSDELRAQECQQHVPAAEEHRPDLEKREEQRAEATEGRGDLEGEEADGQPYGRRNRGRAAPPPPPNVLGDEDEHGRPEQQGDLRHAREEVKRQGNDSDRPG